MKEYIKNIIAESLKDEVDVDREWERLFSSIEKKTISKMKTRRLFLQYMNCFVRLVGNDSAWKESVNSEKGDSSYH